MTRKRLVFASLLLLTLALTGCAPVPVSELYSLPQLSEQYLSLQSLIDNEISSGSEYSSPVRGNYRESVQVYDLNGDGQSEALAFFRTSDGALKISIYQYERNAYAPVCSIIGDGTSIGRIEYADMDGDGTVELIVAWQMDGGISMLSVYSLKAWSGSVLLTADCNSFTTAELEADGKTELILLRYEADGHGFLDMYTLSDSQEMLQSSAELSRGFDTVTRLRTGMLLGGGRALFAEGSYMKSRTITDVLISDGGVLRNISSGVSGVSPTVRSFEVYSEDIDDDGIMETPLTRKLPSQDGSSAEYWVFDWYKMDSNAQAKSAITTFHCYADGWYLDLPEKLSRSISVRREDNLSGERSIVISETNGDAVSDLMSIYTLTGENRHERARIGSRIVLMEDDATVYALRLYTSEFSAAEISSFFHQIHTEWIGPVM